MAKKAFNLTTPMGGLYRRRSWGETPPFTTSDCMNVRPDDTISGRERIGSRPGIDSSHILRGVSNATHMTPGEGVDHLEGAPILLLTTVRWWGRIGPYYAWRETLVAVVYGKNDGKGYIRYSHNSGIDWNTPVGLETVEHLYRDGPMTSAEINQKLYIGDKNYCIEFNPAGTSASGGGGNSTTEELKASKGHHAPKGCLIAASYRGRLLLTGKPSTPHIWFMSKMNDPNDWDYTDTSVTSAVQGDLSQAGSLGEPIQAAIPHGDDCVIFGCAASLWTLRSDPNYGGTLDNLSHRIGISGRQSWCRSSEGWLFMLTQDGVYAMPPGCGETPRSLSRERVPEELVFQRAVEYGGDRFLCMEYDSVHRGVHITRTNADTTKVGNKDMGNTHWWMDVKQTFTQDSGNVASFWPWTTENPHVLPTELAAGFQGTWGPRKNPTCMGVFERFGGPGKSDVMMGAHGGSVWRFSDEETCLEQNFIVLGPFPTTEQTGLYLDGMLHQINASMSNGSRSVYYEIRGGESPEDAMYVPEVDKGHSYNNLEYHTTTAYNLHPNSVSGAGNVLERGVWTEQESISRPRIRAPWFTIRLIGTGGEEARAKVPGVNTEQIHAVSGFDRWSLETITAVTEERGKMRYNNRGYTPLEF